MTTLPHDDEAERLLLSGLWRDPLEADKARWLPGDALFIHKHRWALEVFLHQIDAGDLTFSGVCQELEARGQLGEIGGERFLLDLQSSDIPNVPIDRCIDRILKAKQARDLIAGAGDIAKYAYARQVDDALAVLDATHAKFSGNGHHTTKHAPEAEIFPSLPASARLDPELAHGAGWFVDLYCNHALAISPMTPVIFHESAALWLGAVGIARRLKIPMPFGDVFPNLYILWLALTTLYRKTTALDIGRDLARKVFGHLIAPQDTTPEALLSDLSGAQPSNFFDMAGTDQELWKAERNFSAQRGLVYDEMSGLLAQAGKDYNAGLVEAFLRFYDCDPHFSRSTLQRGRVTVRNSYLSILGASTPAAMSMHMTSERLWANGFWPRFALLTPDSDRPDWQRATKSPEPTDLRQVLHDLHAKLPTPTWPEPPAARDVILGDDVFAAWENYNRALSYDLLTSDLDSKLWGTYGRLPVQCLKVAMILSALDWTQSNDAAPVIELPHLARAISITESWRASAHRALTIVTSGDFDRLQRRITQQLSHFEPDGATMRDLYRAMRDKSPDEIRGALAQLQDLGQVQEIDAKPAGRGRPTKRYRLERE